jgi:hypothetical protein
VDDLGESVWCSTDAEVSSAKNDVCDLKNIYIYNYKKLRDINK